MRTDTGRNRATWCHRRSRTLTKLTRQGSGFRSESALDVNRALFSARLAARRLQRLLHYLPELQKTFNPPLNRPIRRPHRVRPETLFSSTSGPAYGRNRWSNTEGRKWRKLTRNHPPNAGPFSVFRFRSRRDWPLSLEYELPPRFSSLSVEQERNNGPSLQCNRSY
ncbi:hypothetical protein BJX68DRAFT_179299 [Aspergillus pseudodeflectus]|uniref:Uncharacterized protein n=1 Tax=Aspergillus pseudodeflectus TaxID=176178 RepID=A0ABR4L2D0_9EURO